MGYFGSLVRENREAGFRFSFSLCRFEEHYSFHLFGLWIPLPFLQRWHVQPREMMDQWGFGFCERTIQFSWGERTWSWHLPWMMDHIKTEVLGADGVWRKRVASYEAGPDDQRHIETFPYRYVCNDGTVQNVTATVYVERMEWRWRCCKRIRLPFATLVRQSIDIQFSGEVGDRRGSWKGGCVGCGYDMLPGETAEMTLRRMETERRFR